jgi:hypothetical protein
MLYAFPSFAAGSSLACKALRICLSFVPTRMAASLTVTAMRSSNGDLDDMVPTFLHPVAQSGLPLRFLNNGSRILVITQRHKLGMAKPIGSRPLQEFHLSNSLGTQPNALLHFLSGQFIAPT